MKKSIFSILIICCLLIYGIEQIGAAIDFKPKLPVPGYGWDFMTESIRYPPLLIAYEQNQLTPEGNFLVPDCMHTDPVKETIFSDSSDITESRKDYKSKTSSSISGSMSAGGFGFSISGSYSKDSESMFASQQETRTVTITTKYIENRYHVMTSSKCPIDSGFEAWINEMDYALETNDLFLVEELADYLIIEYGTHYLRKVKVGGLIYIDDYIQNKYYMEMKEKSSLQTIKAAAKAKFAGLFSVSASFASTQGLATGDAEAFSDSTKKRVVNTLGGDYKPE